MSLSQDCSSCLSKLSRVLKKLKMKNMLLHKKKSPHLQQHGWI